MWNAAEYRFVDSGIAANNVVTVNTTQQIEGVKSFSNPVYISDGTSRYTAEYSARYITAIDEPAGTTHTYNFPEGTGTLALTSDIPTDYVTEKEFSNLAQQVEDLYALGEQGGVFTVTTVEDTYTARETAGGNLNIADGVSTIVKTIEGSTVKCENLIPYPYAETTKTSNGVTFTDNGDGSITVNGTATAIAPFIFFEGNLPLSGEFTFSGCTGGSSVTYYLQPWLNGTEFQDPQFNAPVTYNWSGNLTLLTMYVQPGITVNNLVIKPMLNAGTTALPYQPYFKGLKNAFFKEIVSTGRNLIPYPYKETTKTTNGITFTDNGDGSLTVNGTAEGGIASFTFSSASNSINFIAGKTYYFSCPHGVLAYQEKQGGAVKYRTAFPITWGEGWIFVSLYMQLNEGEHENNLTLYPMLNFGTTAEPYEPYKQSVLSLPEAVETAEYNTLDFQRGKNVSQGMTKVFDGTENWEGGANSGIYKYYTSIPNNLPNGPCIANLSGINTITAVDGNYYIGGNFNVWTSIETVDKWKAYLAAQYAAGDPVMVRYKTAEVQPETDLNASSDRYLAWKGGSETIVQGTTDNSEYGAEDTVTQEYFTITGGTANGN